MLLSNASKIIKPIIFRHSYVTFTFKDILNPITINYNAITIYSLVQPNDTEHFIMLLEKQANVVGDVTTLVSSRDVSDVTAGALNSVRG